MPSRDFTLNTIRFLVARLYPEVEFVTLLLKNHFRISRKSKRRDKWFG